jgi:molybdenum cofactor biosynthesis enzyme MoaA
VIGSVTRPFCGTCDRVRLTADGQVRNCLFATTETDLRTLLRTGASDGQLAAAWRGAVAPKLPGHGISDPGVPAGRPAHVRHRRLMGSVGYAPRRSRNRIVAGICSRRHVTTVPSIPSAAPAAHPA